MTNNLSEVLRGLDFQIREKLDPLGCIDGGSGAFQTGHVPHVAPFAYLCTRYAGLESDGILAAEKECGRYISEPYKELLSHMNGARWLGVSMHGAVGGFVDRSSQGIGQPVSICYQNTVERPDYIPKGHLCIGAINGEWSSQGHLYLASTGEVELYNARFNLVGARWGSLLEFFADELPRRLSLYDQAGLEVKDSKRLPGDTEDWEHLAQEADKEATAAKGLLGRIREKFRHN